MRSSKRHLLVISQHPPALLLELSIYQLLGWLSVATVLYPLLPHRGRWPGAITRSRFHWEI
uniref:Uncharacterized protein n=1 Tax=Rhizophora mucronata TaxID=61149 RepID=A0A2P2PXG8_RHIMU